MNQSVQKAVTFGLTSLFMGAAMVVSAAAYTTVTPSDLANMGGNGAADAPYQIDSVADWYAIASDLDAHYILTGDINFDNLSESGGYSFSTAYKAIGSSGDGFTGVLDGDGYTIKNLNLQAGLFAEIEGATITNLNFDEVHCANNSGNSGLITYYARMTNEDVTISDITVTNSSVMSSGQCGGLLIAGSKTNDDGSRYQGMLTMDNITMEDVSLRGYVAAGVLAYAYNDFQGTFTNSTFENVSLQPSVDCADGTDGLTSPERIVYVAAGTLIHGITYDESTLASAYAEVAVSDFNLGYVENFEALSYIVSASRDLTEDEFVAMATVTRAGADDIYDMVTTDANAALYMDMLCTYNASLALDTVQTLLDGGQNVTVYNLVVPNGKTLEVPAGVTLTIAEGAILTVENGGALVNNGAIVGTYTQDGVTYYAITVGNLSGGQVTSSHAQAAAGELVTLTTTADSGYNVESVAVLDANGDAVALIGNVFTMPDCQATVSASFKKSVRVESNTATAPAESTTDDVTDETSDEATDDLLEGDVEDTAAGETAPLPFADLDNDDETYNAVATLYDLGVINGMTEDRFEKDVDISRGMITTMLHRLESTPESFANGSFGDIAEGTWYTDGVNWASSNGIVNGYTDGSFGAEKAITNQEMCVILMQYAEYLGCETEVTSVDGAADVADWAQTAVAWAAENGIMTVDADGNFDATSVTTRGEACVMITALMALMAE